MPARAPAPRRAAAHGRFRPAARLRAAAPRDSTRPPRHRRRAAAPAAHRLLTNLSALVLRTGTVRPDRPIFFVLTHSATAHERPALASIAHALHATRSLGWREWAKTCALPSFAAEEVLRSALCLKLHAYHDTGRDHRRRDDQHPGGDGHRAHLGLSLLLAARRRVRRRGAPAAQPPRARASSSSASCATWRRSARCSRSTASPASASSRRSSSRTCAGFRGQRARPDRQRGAPTAPERSHGRAGPVPRDAAHRPAASCSDDPGATSRSCERLVERGDPRRAAAGHGHLGVPHACCATTRSRARCAGPRSTAARSRGAVLGRDAARRALGARRGPASGRRSSGAATTRTLGFFTQCARRRARRRVAPPPADARARRRARSALPAHPRRLREEARRARA